MTGGSTSDSNTGTSDSNTGTSDEGLPDSFNRISADRILRVGPKAIQVAGSPILAGSVTRRSDTNDEYRIDITAFLAKYWTPGAFFSDGDQIRPLAKQDGGVRGSQGCDLSAQGSGQTGEIEPKWPKAMGTSVVDGLSLLWLAIPAGNNTLERQIIDASNVTWSTADEDSDLTVAAGVFKNTGGELLFGCWVTGGTSGDPEEFIVARTTFTDGSTLDFAIGIQVDDDWGD